MAMYDTKVRTKTWTVFPVEPTVYSVLLVS